MTTDRQIEGAFRALLDDDVDMLPDRVFEAVMTGLPTNRQQRRAREMSWLRSMTAIRLGIAGAALGLVVVAGIGVLVRPGGVGGPEPSTPIVVPSASPSLSPGPSPLPTSTPTPAPGYGTTPPDWPTPPPYTPASPLPDPSGSPIPADLIGRVYNSEPLETQRGQAQLLSLRGADDPHCVALYGGRSTCFTILWTPNYPKHMDDPAVRGSARIVDGNLVLGVDMVPNDVSCEGTFSTYSISPDGWTLQGLSVGSSCTHPEYVRH